jgi:hypothetical protein
MWGEDVRFGARDVERGWVLTKEKEERERRKRRSGVGNRGLVVARYVGAKQVAFL